MSKRLYFQGNLVESVNILQPAIILIIMQGALSKYDKKEEKYLSTNLSTLSELCNM